MTAAAVAIVTGGTGGVGRAIVRRLATTMRVAILDLVSADSACGPEGLGADVASYVVDITDRTAVDAAVADIGARYGAPLLLVNCAGIGPVYRDLLDQDDTALLRAVRVNVMGALNVCRAVAPQMRAAASGRIINISSVTAHAGWAGRGEYAASKAALASVSATLAVELGGAGITVNCVAPGHMKTELTMRGDIPWDNITRRTALGRLVTPEEVAEAVAYLASPLAAGLTGSVITIDAGYLATQMSPSGGAQQQ